MDCPCFNCKDRVVGCHAKCAAYQAFDTYKFAERVSRQIESDRKPYRATKWEKFWRKIR